jgi:YesN/AraC family two-component response regulator
MALHLLRSRLTLNRRVTAFSMAAPIMTPSLRIAIADDDRSARELLRKLLDDLGHCVVTSADTGRTLIDGCAKVVPDVVITDNVMGDMTGLDAAAKIYQASPIPIIVLSGYCDPEMVRSAEERHILLYLVKPLSRDHLEIALVQCQERIDVLRHKSEQDVVLLRSAANPAVDDRFRLARPRQ